MDISLDTIWSSFFAIFYRKFFWDFVDGTVRAPGGIQCVSILVSYHQALYDTDGSALVSLDLVRAQASLLASS